ncbi:hypothetical protein [Micromonospora sp. 4G55]|uniref:hypothetical protein n=1 Tax=Micromonospora sp. 4G55 TaxID=2806102 RepID=UPI001A4F126C|nr:hypothetical protein [Micromonospora sp. 4G55]MBM0259828.1 hypothetical protein [Micromonospora sp. 4G55]
MGKELVTRWWNNSWGRLTRRDVWLAREVRWYVVASAGDSETGKVLRWEFDTEDNAPRGAPATYKTTGGLRGLPGQHDRWGQLTPTILQLPDVVGTSKMVDFSPRTVSPGATFRTYNVSVSRGAPAESRYSILRVALRVLSPMFFTENPTFATEPNTSHEVTRTSILETASPLSPIIAIKPKGVHSKTTTTSASEPKTMVRIPPVEDQKLFLFGGTGAG